MTPRVTIGLAVVLLCGSLASEGRAESQSTSSSISGTITSLELDAIAPTVTVTDSSKKLSMVLVDRYSTTVTKQNHSAQLSDLKVGQQVQVTGTYKAIVDRIVAKTIAITQEPTAAPASSTAATTVTSAKTGSPTAASSTAVKAAPTVLKSIPKSEKD